MKLKHIIPVFIIMFAFQNVLAQANILNAKFPEEIGLKSLDELESEDKPFGYGYVSDRDILFSKMVWEKVSLDERINFPLYFPVDTVNIGSDRRSLYHVLKKNIEDGYIRVFTDSYFTQETSLEDIGPSMKMEQVTDAGIDWMNENGVSDTSQVPEEYVIRREIEAGDLNSYLIKGLWYFDKRQGELRYRILGIAPAAPDVNFIDSDDEVNKEPIALFWVFFPEIRDILHESKAFNARNNSKPISFDHLLNSRRFSGTIYKEENVFGDREIKEYIFDNALMQLLESERVKNQIRDKEQDMWSY